jgi:hypothetical protein
MASKNVADQQTTHEPESESRVKAARTEETHEDRSERLDIERLALKPSPADDSLRERLLALLSLQQHTDIANRGGVSHERALFRYAAATSKAVAMALQGTDYVCSNEPFETSFTTEDAAFVLCGLSALLGEAPGLVEDLRHADRELSGRITAADEGKVSP